MITENEDTETMLPNGRRAPSPETEGATDAVISEVKKEDAVLALFDKPFKEKIMAVISTMKARYGSLTIAGVNDKAGFDAVYKARQHVKSVRLEVTQVHKDEKAEALDYCKRLDAAKRTLLAEIEPVEEALQAKEDKINEEKAFIAAESQRKIDAMIKARAEAFQSVNAQFDFTRLATMPEADFQALYLNAKDTFDKAEAAKAAQAAELARLQKEEAERKEKERAEMEAKAKEQAAKEAELKAREDAVKAAQEKVLADQRAIEDGKRKEAEAKARAEELEKAKEAARLEAIAETERKAKEAEAAKVRKEAEEKAEAERKAALRSDREKMCSYIEAIRTTPIPKFESVEMEKVLSEALSRFHKALKDSVIGLG